VAQDALDLLLADDAEKAFLLARSLDGMLACGRHVSCDANSHGFMREIPQCWLTGQAAGVAAALAVNAGVEPRHVDIPSLQKALRAQGVFLQDPAPAGVGANAAAATA